MANNFPPKVTVHDSTVELGTKIAMSGTFTVDDLDPGSVVTKYRFRDNGLAPTSGYLEYKGAIVQSGTWLEIDAADLGSVFYNAALLLESESIGVQVFDGQFWSEADFGLFFTVTPNTEKPIATIDDLSILATEAAEVASLIKASDPDGYPIIKYMIVDRLANANGGYFTLNGVQLTSAVWHEIDAADLGGLRYVGGQFGQTERVGVRAFDGKFWSDLDEADFTTTPNLFRPEANAQNLSLPINKSTTADKLFNPTDADGNTIKRVMFYDTGNSATGGYFSLNGVQIAANTWFEVAIEDLGTVKYTSAALTNSEKFRVKVFDGRYWSTVSTGVVTTVDKPTIDIAASIRLNELEFKTLSSLITQTDGGPAITKYEIIDLTDNNINDGPNTSGKIVRSGVVKQELVVHTVNSLDAHNWGIRGGLKDLGREFDTYQVRAFNGVTWSDWYNVEVDTTHQAGAALLDLGSWSNTLQTPAVLTYSFPENLPDYYIGGMEDNNFVPMSPAMRAAIREMLDFISGFANLTFIEVPDDTVGGTMRFGTAQAAGGILGWAYPPQVPDQRAGDFWFNNQGATDLTGFDVTPGGLNFAVLLHEFGHAVGLKHPDNTTGAGEPPYLPSAILDHRYTVMPSIANPPKGVNNMWASTHMLFDVMALQELYSANTTSYTGDDQWRWDPNDNNFRLIWDPAGDDTLNLTNNTLNATIDLRPGRYSSVGGVDRNLAIAYNTWIEKARGGAGNDTIIGNELDNLLIGNKGNDTFFSNGGTDTMRGGEGNDWYIVKLGDGFDIIDEQQLAGRDRIELRSYGALDNFTQDLSFRKIGRDLLIDLTIDGGLAQGGITVKDYQWGGSRVEILRFVDHEGEEIVPDVDLTSIFSSAGVVAKQYTVTNFVGQFGNIAVPV